MLLFHVSWYFVFLLALLGDKIFLVLRVSRCFVFVGVLGVSCFLVVRVSWCVVFLGLSCFLVFMFLGVSCILVFRVTCVSWCFRFLRVSICFGIFAFLGETEFSVFVFLVV